jgi:hypothetical protein
MNTRQAIEVAKKLVTQATFEPNETILDIAQAERI